MTRRGEALTVVDEGPTYGLFFPLVSSIKVACARN